MSRDNTHHRSLRQDRETVDGTLDELDRRAEDAQPSETNRFARRHPRYRYRLTLKAEFEQPGGQALHYSVAARNISRNGIGFLVGHFIYPGARCKLCLISPHNYSQTVGARIVRCNYLLGTGSLHEVGVKFDEPIDVTAFQATCDNRGQARVLVADDDPSMHKLVQVFLKDLSIELTSVHNGNEAVESAISGHHDLILMDMEMPELDGLGATRELRKRGYVQPIVAMTALHGEKARTACMEAGCTSYVNKPVQREVLTRLVHGVVYEPLESSFASDPEMAEMIDHFVDGLPATIKELQGAFDAEDTKALELSIRHLKGQGASFGFDVITETATELETAVQAGAELAAIRESVNELVKWCRAARRVGDEQPSEQAEAGAGA